MRSLSSSYWRTALALWTALGSIGMCDRVLAQSQLGSSGIPQATSSFPVEHGVVNLNNGVLHLELPIVNYAQRGNVELPATLNYDSNIWKINTIGSTGSSNWFPNETAPSGEAKTGGWYVSYNPTNQSITPVQWGTVFCNSGDGTASIHSAISWKDQSGSEHIFPATTVSGTCTGRDNNSYVSNNTAAAYATDGSGYYAVVNDYATQFFPAVNIYDRSGTLVASNNLNVPIVQPGAPVGQPTSRSSFGGIGLADGPLLPVDRNGNSPVYSSSAVLDTMNRKLVEDPGITNVVGGGQVEYINVPVAGGNTATYTINYKTISVSSSFGYTSTSLGVVHDAPGLAMSVVSSVVLPDGTSYQFDYYEGFYGELKSMTLPHGGQVSFTYSTASGISGGAPIRLVQSHTGSDGLTNFLWTQASTSSYSQAGTTCGLITNQVTTLSAKNTYKFSTCNGNILLQEVDHGSATASKIDAIDLYSYDTSHPCPTLGTATVYHIGCNGLQWMNITGKTTVLPPTSSAGKSLVTDTQYTYDHPETGIPSSVKQWDYYQGAPTSLPDSPPGLPAREVDTTLGYTVNGALFPTEVDVKDSTGTVVSSTTYAYDEPTYMSSTPSSAPNHSNTLVTGNRGNLTTVTKCCGWNGTANVPLASHTWYDDAGTVLATEDAKHNKTKLSSYDPTDTFPTTIELPSTVSGTTTVSHVGQRTYDPSSGQIASATDENGQTATYTFDQYGRPYQVQFSNAGDPITLQTTTYPTANETDVSVLQSPGVLLSATSIVDAYGRPFQSTQGGISTETYYDAQGRVDHVTNAHTGTPSATDGTTYSSHDELGRLSSVTLPNGYSTTYAYAQNTVTVTDPLNHSRQMRSDAFGNTTAVLEPDSTGSLSLVTSYAYNWQNQLTQVLQQGGTTDPAQWRKRTFSFDGVGRMVSQTTPEAGTTLFGYDDDGNLISTQNQNATNNTTQYTYDALSRVLTAKVDGGPTYAYTYDGQDASGDAFGKGLLTSASNGTNVQTRWQHDVFGRTVSSAYCLPSDCSFNYKVQSGFDFQGNQTSLTYPDSRQVQWTYDQLNRPTGETYAQWGANSVNTPYISNVSYTPGGQLQQATLGQTVQFGATYDVDSNLSSLVYMANGTPIVQKTYAWDKNAANLKSITDLAAGRKQTYTYDQLDRLLIFDDTGTTSQACVVTLPGIPSASQSYTIDPWGNMKSSGTDAFPQSAGPDNRLQNFLYDAAGNLKQDGSTQYSYRADGLMTTSDSTTYTYDAEGQRVRKDGQSSNEYIYFGGQILAMRNPSTGAWTDRIYGPMGATATVPGTQTALPVYRATDHLGSLIYTLDSSGNITGSNSSLPYGQLISNSTGDAFPFTDHERDSENGTDATLYRHYSSRHGRWLSPDPSNGSYNLMDPQSLNRYAYVSNRPVNKTDSLGLDDDDDDDGDDDTSSNGSASFDLGRLFNWFFGLFGGGHGGSPSPPKGGIPSLTLSFGTTQPGAGSAYVNASLYSTGSTGVATGSWVMLDMSSGLDREGILLIPNEAAPAKSSDTQQLNYTTANGNSHTNQWAIKWNLSQPSARGGYIIQHIEASNSRTGQNEDYYEAWEVPRGQQVTTRAVLPYDDRFIGGKGSRGKGTARFYEGMTLLPREFRVGRVPTAGSLWSTYTLNDPLPTTGATKAVIRTWSVP